MENEIHLVTASNDMGRGLQKGIAEVYRRHKEVGNLLKIKLEIAVNDNYLQPAVEAIAGAGHTGRVGDGKIFIFDLKERIRIRTDETGNEAIG